MSTRNILLAVRMKDMTYTADMPLSGRVLGEIGRDGVPTFLSGKIAAGAGDIIDKTRPDYPMPIDRAEINVEWDSNRRVHGGAVQVLSGQNRFHAACPSRAAQ